MPRLNIDVETILHILVLEKRSQNDAEVEADRVMKHFKPDER